MRARCEYVGANGWLNLEQMLVRYSECLLLLDRLPHDVVLLMSIVDTLVLLKEKVCSTQLLSLYFKASELL